MKALVTGAAGFIGSRLSLALIEHGIDVTCVDCLSDYYDARIKAGNLQMIEKSGKADVQVLDLAKADISSLLSGVDVVFHLAGQPGVRDSWDADFPVYLERNVLVTNLLLNAVKDMPLKKFVFSSSSSIYGDALTHPTPEWVTPKPRSPYGVSKLAAEHLCAVYAENFDIPTISLRYFTVFGGGQRPDMAFHRIINCGLGLDSKPFRVFGSGQQRRDFTHVSDVVEGNIAAAFCATEPGAVFNIAGGLSASVLESIAIVEEILGRVVPIEIAAEALGDVSITSADTSLAAAQLSWVPRVDLIAGLAEQILWQTSTNPRWA